MHYKKMMEDNNISNKTRVLGKNLIGNQTRLLLIYSKIESSKDSLPGQESQYLGYLTFMPQIC